MTPLNHPATTLQILAAWQVKLQTGQLTDTFKITNDFVHLSHNGGIHLYDDMLIVLAVGALRAPERVSCKCQVPAAFLHMILRQY